MIAYFCIFIDEKYIDSKGYPLFNKVNDYTEDADMRDYGFSPKIDMKHLNLMPNYEVMNRDEVEKLLKYLGYYDRNLGYEGEDWWTSN